MRMFHFFESLRGAELIAFCGLLITSMYLYMGNVVPANAGTASSLASCAMAILTAGAIVKLSRLVRARMQRPADRQA